MSARAWINTHRDRTYYLTAFLSTSAGIVLSVLRLPNWGLGFIGIGLLGTVAFLFSKFDDEKRKKCLNPDLIILKDEIVVIVEKAQRLVNRHILFRARDLVHEYRFKFFWTGSSPNVRIECSPHDGEIQLDSTLRSKALRWQLCILHFRQSLRRRKTKLVAIRYIMPDPAHSSEPYQIISYAHVWQCDECVIHLSFKDGLKPSAVYFVESNEANEVVKKEIVSPQQQSSLEFVVQKQPVSGYKYSIEWDF